VPECFGRRSNGAPAENNGPEPKGALRIWVDVYA